MSGKVSTAGFMLAVIPTGWVGKTHAEPTSSVSARVPEIANPQPQVVAALTDVLRIVQEPIGRQLQSAFIWEKEMIQQTKSLREDAHWLSPRNKARAPVRKRSSRG